MARIWGQAVSGTVKSDTHRKIKSPPFLARSYSSLVVYTLALLPILIQSLNVKYTFLTVNGGGYEVIALQMGYSGYEQLSSWEKYSPFISDLVVSGGFLSALLLMALLVVKPVYRAYVAAFVTLVSSLILYIQLKSFWEVGSFLPAGVLVAGLTDVGNMFIADYVSISSLSKLFILMMFSFLMILFAHQLDKRHGALKEKYNPNPKRIVLLISFIGISASIWGNISLSNEYSRSVLISAFKSFVDYKRLVVSEFDNLEPSELRREYRELTNSNPNGMDPEYWGRAKDYDVLFFILESVPEQCARLTNPTNALPNMNSLIPHAFVSSNHYSTYPYTVRAVFSIYSSWYPSNQSKDFIRIFDSNGEKLVAPGVVRSLKEAGYKTAVFVPDYTDNWEHDKQRYDALGFEKQVFPVINSLKNIKRGNDGWRNEVKVKDEATLVLLKNELANSLKNNERYFYAYQPQYTHGPWPNVKPGYSEEETIEECTKLLKLVDSWIGEVIQVVHKYDRLEKTLIVMTGDHGIRTNREHPGFNGGTVDGITFNVPLLIFSPGVIKETKYIDWITSHIDIAPSVLSMLGIKNGRKYEQGFPVWDKRLKDRYTFFFARNYLGADAYYYKNNIYMIRYLFNHTKHSIWQQRLSFKGVANTSEERSWEIIARVNKMVELQNNWARMLLPSTMKTPEMN